MGTITLCGHTVTIQTFDGRGAVGSTMTMVGGLDLTKAYDSCRTKTAVVEWGTRKYTVNVIGATPLNLYQAACDAVIESIVDA